ncbi:hypothetical protein SAMN02745121_00584 [Nannocystis exedens]|uniref:Uncharacterized protein n=1 Tax=Nannocystis exedens TaxID=54 RepID=A0A1I1TA36_9BACT|nr:hypothetical protein NAEX_09279 [Nannocystis exedens]SFD55456.1 hypothetical protein SAMN02745121_00584 [Nannocystis exedens]
MVAASRLGEPTSEMHTLASRLAEPTCRPPPGRPAALADLAPRREARATDLAICESPCPLDAHRPRPRTPRTRDARRQERLATCELALAASHPSPAEVSNAALPARPTLADRGLERHARNLRGGMPRSQLARRDAALATCESSPPSSAGRLATSEPGPLLARKLRSPPALRAARHMRAQERSTGPGDSAARTLRPPARPLATCEPASTARSSQAQCSRARAARMEGRRPLTSTVTGSQVARRRATCDRSWGAPTRASLARRDGTNQAHRPPRRLAPRSLLGARPAGARAHREPRATARRGDRARSCPEGQARSTCRSTTWPRCRGPSSTDALGGFILARRRWPTATPASARARIVARGCRTFFSCCEVTLGRCSRGTGRCAGSRSARVQPGARAMADSDASERHAIGS